MTGFHINGLCGAGASGSIRACRAKGSGMSGIWSGCTISRTSVCKLAFCMIPRPLCKILLHVSPDSRVLKQKGPRSRPKPRFLNLKPTPANVKPHSVDAPHATINYIYTWGVRTIFLRAWVLGTCISYLPTCPMTHNWALALKYLYRKPFEAKVLSI